MSANPRERAPITDPATQLALEHLADSRQRLADWTTNLSRARSRRSEGFSLGSFNPRSETLKMLMSAALPRLPWIRWGITLAPILWRFWRRR